MLNKRETLLVPVRIACVILAIGMCSVLIPFFAFNAVFSKMAEILHIPSAVDGIEPGEDWYDFPDHMRDCLECIIEFWKLPK